VKNDPNASKEKATADEVLKTIRGNIDIVSIEDVSENGKEGERKPEIQVVGKVLAAFVTLLSLALIFIAVQWILRSPTPPTIAGQDSNTVIASYRAISDVSMDQTNKIFDLFITRTLLPILTGILGILIGRSLNKPAAHSL
jgi:hypothetical protein